MLTVNRPSTAPLIKFYVGTGGVKKGQLAKADSNTAIVATEGATTAVIIGIATDDFAATEVGTFYDLRGAEIEADIYQGGVTDAFTDANIGSQFDLYHAGTTAEYYIDPNDTANPMFVVQSHDDARATCIVRIIPSLLYC